jgi:hypothetical protein
MNNHGAIAVRQNDTGEVAYHAAATPAADYDTLCGLSVNDGDLCEEVETPPKARINCAQCYGVWSAARAFKASDFAAKALKS